MKNKKIITALALIILSTPIFAQMNRANRHYDFFRYSKAIPLYKKAANSRNEEKRKAATARLADCYRLINNTEEARSWYLKAVQFNNTNPENYFYLGQALRSLQQYDQARNAFLTYAKLVPDDAKAPVYARFCNDIKVWQGLAPLAEIKNVSAANSKYADFSPVFYEDGVVFVSDRNIDFMEGRQYGWTNFGYLDLLFSTPKYFNDFWGDLNSPVSLSKQFNQTWHDGPVALPGNGRIYITRTTLEKVKQGNQNIATNRLKIYYGEQKDNKVIYLPFPYNSEAYSVGHPAVSSNGNTMIFVSDKPEGSGGSDLYVSNFTAGKWSEPVNLGKHINSAGNEVFPTLVNDTLLYFSSDGMLGYGGLDIFVSHKTSTGWSTPENLKAPINSSYDDFGIAFAKDLKSGFFSSNRPGGKGSDDIYAFRFLNPPAKVEPEPAKDLMVSGYVKDKTTGLPIEGATVFVLNTRTNKVKVLKTKPDGLYTMPILKLDMYLCKAVMPGYIDDCLNFRIDSAFNQENFNTPRDLTLDKLFVNKVFKVENIYYDLDKWYIRDDAKPALDNLVALMKKYPITAELSSHTDCRASNAYNDELSQKRAESAVRYIVLQGVDPSRLIARGYGETRLVNKCSDGVECTEEEHQANRRTEFKILSVEKPEATSTFDPSVFKDGDMIESKLLSDDFFGTCFGAPENETK